MNKKNSTLTVSIKLPRAEQDTQASAEIITYRWDRIAGFVLVVIIAGVLLARALLPGGSEPDNVPLTGAGAEAHPRALSASKASSGAEVQGEPGDEHSESGEAIAGNLSEANATAAAVVAQAQPSPNEVTIAPSPEQIVDRAGAEISEISESIEAERGDGALAQIDSAITAEPGANEAEPGGASAAGSADQTVLRAGETKILASQVSRFLITNAIRSLEPVGDIDDIVIQDQGAGMLAIYVFSELQKMRGKTVYYVWLRDGKQVARVRVGVGSDRWRSSSSKILNNSMRGQWRVELKTADGQVLAMTNFEY